MNSYESDPYGRWPFKYRIQAVENPRHDEDADWQINMQRWSRVEERWYTRRYLRLYPEDASKKLIDRTRKSSSQ